MEGAMTIMELMESLGLNDDEAGRAQVSAMVEQNKILKCLIVVDYQSKAVFATVVARKGHDEHEYAVSFIMEAVKWLGYTSLILKSDNEPAMLHLV